MFIQCPPLQRGQEERVCKQRSTQDFWMGNSALLCWEAFLALWKEESGDQIDYLNVKPCPPAWALHPPLWMGHKASSQHFIDGAAWSQVQSRRELHFHGSVHRKGVQAKQQMWFIIAQPFCFKGLRGLNVTVYKWELLGEIDQCKAQSDFKGI